VLVPVSLVSDPPKVKAFEGESEAGDASVKTYLINGRKHQMEGAGAGKNKVRNNRGRARSEEEEEVLRGGVDILCSPCRTHTRPDIPCSLWKGPCQSRCSHSSLRANGYS